MSRCESGSCIPTSRRREKSNYENINKKKEKFTEIASHLNRSIWIESHLGLLFIVPSPTSRYILRSFGLPNSIWCRNIYVCVCGLATVYCCRIYMFVCLFTKRMSMFTRKRDKQTKLEETKKHHFEADEEHHNSM